MWMRMFTLADTGYVCICPHERACVRLSACTCFDLPGKTASSYGGSVADESIRKALKI